MTEREVAISTVCAFTAGFILGVAATIRDRVRTPQYVPTLIEAEVAKMLEPDDLEHAAFLIERDGLVGYAVNKQQAN